MGAGIAVDSSGSAYVTGYAESVNFPTTAGAYQTTLNGATDIFVTKFSPSGTSLVYSTYLGGSYLEWSGNAVGVAVNQGIAVDATGNAYVVGDTGSTDFPTTANAFQRTCAVQTSGSCFSPFLAKLNSNGSQLLYSTYLSGSNGDEVAALALDSAGHAYLAGITESADFPTTPNSLTPNRPAGCPTTSSEGFVSEIDTTASGSASLIYSTYLDSFLADSGYCASVSGIAVDTSGFVFTTGNWVIGSGSSAQAGGFVAKFDLSKAGLSAYLGSTQLGSYTYPAALAVDTSGSPYVTGTVYNGCFYVNGCIFANGFQATPGGGHDDAFVAKLTPDANSIVYLSFLGGSHDELGYGIAADASGNAYVIGSTTSTDFPISAPIQTGNANMEGFLTVVDPTGQVLVYSTLFGGPSGAYFVAVAVDGNGNAYLSGEALSNDLPVVHAFQSTLPAVQNPYGGFVAKISPADASGIAFGPGALAFAAQDYKTPSAPQTMTLYAAGSQPIQISGISTTGNFSQTNNCGASVPATSSCIVNVTFTPTAVGSRIGTVRVNDNAIGSPHSVALTGTGNGIPKVTLTPGTLTFPKTVIGVTGTSKTVKVANTGAGGLDISSITATGDFAQSNSCPNIPTAGSCLITVTFTPTASGARSGTLSIADNATNTPQKVTLAGTGTSVKFSKSNVTFAKQTVGTTSAPQVVALTNVGAVPLNITSIGVAGLDPADFAQTNTCGAAINPGANCAISVTFTPSALGLRKATVSVVDDGGGSPQVINVSGTGK